MEAGAQFCPIARRTANNSATSFRYAVDRVVNKSSRFQATTDRLGERQQQAGHRQFRKPKEKKLRQPRQLFTCQASASNGDDRVPAVQAQTRHESRKFNRTRISNRTSQNKDKIREVRTRNESDSRPTFTNRVPNARHAYANTRNAPSQFRKLKEELVCRF